MLQSIGLLPLFAAATLAFAVLMYVVMDGTDLGVGILFFATPDATQRAMMVDSILPVWDANETWLVLGGGGLIAMFPLAYSVFLSALYPVFFALLMALIFRGMAIEFRENAAERRKRWWDAAMLSGSLVSAFCQGVLLGSLIQGIHFARDEYAGGLWDWLTPFTVFCGIGLVIGYGWLGACWLIWRTEGELSRRARRLALLLATATALATLGVAAWTPLLNLSYLVRWFGTGNRWHAVVVALAYLVIAIGFLHAWGKHRQFAPLLMALAWFVLSFFCVLATLFPLMLPPALSVRDAAAPDSTLSFVLSGSAVLIPAIVCYSSFSFWVFRGKVKPQAQLTEQ
ncbi:cytochrome d ubiquinol oxidase subunit II [Pararobbsia alpina]|uniref:Cytochrome bd-I ubiquinol oxidase subunit 2 n=1 Tax=Pararobbsia alpina TaxID=621374 RepID=A0A6S7BSN1_9BURK|nr:cytochrome d ubiquinol oxidase subunit II [Pararobbsia alpina]CAB3801163.1 Cytochrome bd-I ubiquinol oxidase subunit 2 [Pararobbsia alpina]